MSPFRCEGLAAFEQDGNLMIGAAAVRYGDAKEFNIWLSRWLREKRQEVVQRELLGPIAKPSEPAPPLAELPAHYFVFNPPGDWPTTIGYAPGSLDRHGNVLVPSRFVPIEHPQCTLTFTIGTIVEATEHEPSLLRFLESNKVFRRAQQRDLEKHNGNGHGGE